MNNEVLAATETVVAEINRIIDDARVLEARDTAREQDFAWARALTYDQKVEALLAINNERTTFTDRAKYIAVDRTGGKFLIDKTDGTIYGIKGYGQVHKGKQFGNIFTADPYALATVVWGPWHARYVRRVQEAA